MRPIAVHTFLALMEANEPFPPADLELRRNPRLSMEQADEFRDLAERVIQGRSFRPAIKLPRGRGEALRAYWREHPAE